MLCGKLCEISTFDFKVLSIVPANFREPETFPKQGQDKSGHAVNPFSHPEKTHVAIIQNKHVDCMVDDMVIALAKQNLQVRET